MSPTWCIAGILLGVVLGPASCPLTAQSDGKSSRTPQSQTVPQQAASNTASIPFEVSGRVLNGRTHQPVYRALVQFGSRRVLTDHDGIFRLPEVTAATGSFRVTKPGFFPDFDDSPHTYTLASDTPIELILTPEAILSGTVIDTNGEPVPHLSVTARASTYNETGHQWNNAGRTQTLSDGTFRLSLAAGVYTLQVTSTGRPLSGADYLQSLSVPANPASLSEAIHLAPGDQVHLDLRPSFRRAFDVALRIDHGPERGFPMLTARPASGPAINLNAIPNRDDPGSFHIALPNGTYEIIADIQNEDGRLQGRTSVTVAGHDVAGVQLPLSPTPAFPVAVEVDSSATSDNTTPIPTVQQLGLSFHLVASSASLNEQVYQISTHGSAQSTFSLPEGTYRFHARTGGAWYVTAVSYGGTDLLEQNLSLVPGAAVAELRVRVSNRTADLTGSVQLAAAPTSAWIYLIATTPSSAPILMLRSGANGSFSRPYLAPGTYRAIAFEHSISADLQSPEVLNRFLGHVQTLTVNSGDHATLTLNAVPAAEMTP